MCNVNDNLNSIIVLNDEYDKLTRERDKISKELIVHFEEWTDSFPRPSDWSQSECEVRFLFENYELYLVLVVYDHVEVDIREILEWVEEIGLRNDKIISRVKGFREFLIPIPHRE